MRTFGFLPLLSHWPPRVSVTFIEDASARGNLANSDTHQACPRYCLLPAISLMWPCLGLPQFLPYLLDDYSGTLVGMNYLPVSAGLEQIVVAPPQTE